jgi:two-component system sensor histidine kinase BarA
MDSKNKEDYLSVDWPLALKLANNEPAWAKKMLNLLVDELPQVKIELEQALTLSDFELIGRLVHKLHGACCYCGVPRLKVMTEQFKTEVKLGDRKTLQQFTEQIITEIDAIIAVVKADNFEK